jgi:ABC-type multidrug transport system ATPase subunit
MVKTFSGGMKRRLEIARGLLHTPRILFLDEPTLGLEPQSRNQLWTHVKHRNETEGVTVFLTTHYMDEAERTAHRIAIIDHGHIVAQGTAQSLKQHTGAESLEGCDHCLDSGNADSGRLHGCRVSAVQHRNGADRVRVQAARRTRICGSGDRDRVDAERHAGLSADHELPRDADLRPVRRALPAEQSPDSVDARRAQTRCPTASTASAGR